MERYKNEANITFKDTETVGAANNTDTSVMHGYSRIKMLLFLVLKQSTVQYCMMSNPKPCHGNVLAQQCTVDAA